MIRPKKLQFGDKIGFFSPSSAATHWAPKRYARAKKFLTDKGFTLIAGNLTHKNDFYRSGSIQARANELNQLINDPSVRCIISTIGGLNSNALLPYIDYATLKRDPKIIIGYSDVTALLLGIYSKINLITFYGPALVASFGEIGAVAEATYHYFTSITMDAASPLPKTIQNPLQWTDQYLPWEAQKNSKALVNNQLITLNPGCVTGRLIVGNLNTMLGIYGSPYMPEIKKGDILVIEDSLKNPGIIERSFAHLKINGIFDKIGGLVLGKHEKFDDGGTGRKPFEILQEVAGPLNIPFLADYDCAHTHPMITLPIGIQATLDANNQTLSLVEKWVEN